MLPNLLFLSAPTSSAKDANNWPCRQKPHRMLCGRDYSAWSGETFCSARFERLSCCDWLIDCARSLTLGCGWRREIFLPSHLISGSLWPCEEFGDKATKSWMFPLFFSPCERLDHDVHPWISPHGAGQSRRFPNQKNSHNSCWHLLEELLVLSY